MDKLIIPKPNIISKKYLIKYFDHFDSIFQRKKDKKIILSCSGGSDSMALLYILFKYYNYRNIRIVHINHNLRNDSFKDEMFVTKVGLELGIKTYIRHLDPSEILKNESIESWARKGRYRALSEILIDSNFDIIVTGHHKNDQVETILKNISEKTGLFGLTGLKSMNGNIIRPLLPFSKLELMDIIDKYKIPFIQDSSNENLNFKRNFIRKKILDPWFSKDVNILDSIAESSYNFSEYQDSLKYFINEFINEYVIKIKKNQNHIVKKYFDKMPDVSKVMVLQILTNSIGLLRKYDFLNIKNFLNKNEIGGIYRSRFGWDLLVDRQYYILMYQKDLLRNDKVEIILGQKTHYLGYDYIFVKTNSMEYISGDPNLEFIDQSKVKNKKLILRQWRSGDFFRPLGMSGNQKVSDYLVNNKINRFDKLNQSVLIADDKIIWLCGHRIDETVKINLETTKVIRLKRFRSHYM